MKYSEQFLDSEGIIQEPRITNNINTLAIH